MTLTNALTLLVSMLALLSSPNRLSAQGVSDAMLLHPPPDSWPGYHGDYSGRRHSKLAQITPQNIHKLSLAWAFQSGQMASIKASPLLLVDATFRGMPRKMLLQASRNGYFFVLDRTTGESLLTVPFGPANWALGIDKKGQPIPNPEKDPAPDGRLVAPDEGGLTNYRSPSFDPKTGLFIVDASISYGIYFSKPEDGTWGWAGGDYDLVERAVLDAIDYQTGKIRWTHRLGSFGGSNAGVLTTSSGLIFTGDATGNMLALDTATGKTLWHAGLGAGIESSPTTYELDGRQYVLVGAGQTLFAWALPEGSHL